MADISKITASNGTTYDIKDATARDSISQRKSFELVSTTPVADLDSPGSVGIVIAGSSTSNIPLTLTGAQVCIVETIGNLNGRTIQLFYHWNAVYVRRGNAGTFETWKKIPLETT